MQAGHSDDHNPFFKWCGCLFREDLKFLFRWMLLECESYIQKQPPEVFYEKGAFLHIVKFVGNHPCQSLFFNKVASWGLQFFLNIGSSIGVLLWISRIYRCFPRTSVFLYNTSGPLLRHGCPLPPSGLRKFLATESPLKMMMKSSFDSQDVQVFVLIFWACIKTAW